VSSIEPYISAYKKHSGEEVSGGFVVAGGDGAELLDSGEEVLDQVARFVHVFIINARRFSAGFWRDDDLFSRRLQRFYDPFIGVEGFIGENGIGGDVWQKSI
jgi:hypothetical protein